MSGTVWQPGNVIMTADMVAYLLVREAPDPADGWVKQCEMKVSIKDAENLVRSGVVFAVIDLATGMKWYRMPSDGVEDGKHDLIGVADAISRLGGEMQGGLGLCEVCRNYVPLTCSRVERRVDGTRVVTWETDLHTCYDRVRRSTGDMRQSFTRVIG